MTEQRKASLGSPRHPFNPLFCEMMLLRSLSQGVTEVTGHTCSLPRTGIACSAPGSRYVWSGVVSFTSKPALCFSRHQREIPVNFDLSCRVRTDPSGDIQVSTSDYLRVSALCLSTKPTDKPFNVPVLMCCNLTDSLTKNPDSSAQGTCLIYTSPRPRDAHESSIHSSG